MGEENPAKTYTKKIMQKTIDHYGTTECRALKKDRVGCKEIVDFSYEALKEALK